MKYYLSLGLLMSIGLVASTVPLLAGGTCLLHPQPFKLQSDTVRWSMTIKAGGECIQGLRWSTIILDNIAITQQPKAGRLMIQGPAFRYFSDEETQGPDFFKISIRGTSLRVNGASSIEVVVTKQ